jgi:hypothetical protein
MSITLELPDELTTGIARRAETEGQSMEAYAIEALRRHLATNDLQESQQLGDIEWALAQRRERR